MHDERAGAGAELRYDVGKEMGALFRRSDGAEALLDWDNIVINRLG